jgi:hypothetical protein
MVKLLEKLEKLIGKGIDNLTAEHACRVGYFLVAKEEEHATWLSAIDFAPVNMSMHLRLCPCI